MHDVARYIDMLRSRGLKATPRRAAIIEIFASRGGHLTPEEVWTGLQKRFKRCGLPGVYRNLESMAGCGILTRILRFDRRQHYGLCGAAGEGHHHHITCIRCGRVDEIGRCPIAGRKTMNGYRVVSHFMQVNGICAGCQVSASDAAPGTRRCTSTKKPARKNKG